MRANRCSTPGERRVSHFDAVQATQITANTPIQPQEHLRVQSISPHSVQCNIWHICNSPRAAPLPTTTTTTIAAALTPPPPSTSDSRVSALSPRVLLCFGEISAGNCESFTSCSHNGLWDYAKHSASAALPIDRHQRRPLEHTGKRRRALNEDVTAITQARFTDTLSVCSSSSRTRGPPLPTFLKNFFFDSLFEVQLHLLQLFHNACPFWICMNSLSRCFCCHLDLQWCALYSVAYCISMESKE